MEASVLSLGSGSAPSLLFNNLSIDAGMVAYVHNTSVCVFLEAAARSASVSPVKMGYKDAAAVLQVKWVHAGTGAPLLVLATTAGFQVWDSTGKVALFTHAADAFCRGAAGSDECSKIFVGTSAGKVLVAAGSSPISLTGSFDAAGSPISCIDVHRTTLVTACDAGDVAVWDAASHASLCRFPGVAGHPCTSVKLRDTLVIAAFTSGHVRLFDICSASLVAEVAAHARCITALDLHPVTDMFVTAGEDAVLNVWSLPEVASGSSKVELVCSKLVEDHTFTGVQFFKSPRLAILASSYDNNVMVLLQ